MNRHLRAAWWRLTDRLRPCAAPLFAAALAVCLAAVLAYGPTLHWR